MPSINLTTRAKDPKVINPLESILFGIDFTPILVAGETLTNPPTISGGTGLTFGSPLVNTSTFLNDAGSTVAVGDGVQVRISGAADLTDYGFTCACVTSLGNTRAIYCQLECRAS